MRTDIRLGINQQLLNKSNYFCSVLYEIVIGGFISKISFYLQGVHYHERMDRYRSMHRIHCCCSPGSLRNHPTLNKLHHFFGNFSNKNCHFSISKNACILFSSSSGNQGVGVFFFLSTYSSKRYPADITERMMVMKNAARQGTLFIA